MEIEQTISEPERLEYMEGSKVCMHYEVLRRQGLTFFWVVNAAFIFVLFRQQAIDNVYLPMILPALGAIISLATLNNDIRVAGYYWLYVRRLQEIEQKYGMSLYTHGQMRISTHTRSIPNSFFFRIIPGFSIFIWKGPVNTKWLHLLSTILLDYKARRVRLVG